MVEIDTQKMADNGMEWAKTFCACMKENNWTIDDITEDLMVGWFANAIEVSHTHRLQNKGQDNEQENNPL